MTHYLYRRCDNNEVEAVDFDTMMTQDCLGYIRLPDGVEAKRDWQLESLRDMPAEEGSQRKETGPRKIDSITCGFPSHQLQEFQDHCKAHGITGVEPVANKHDIAPNGQPWFYEVRCDNEGVQSRLAHTLGLHNRNGENMGWSLTADQLESARRRVSKNN